MAVDLRRRRFTVDEYERMAETGILDEDERVELIEGEIVEMSPIGPPHASVVARMTAVLVPRLAGRAIVWSQSSLVLRGQTSYLQPDLILLHPRERLLSIGQSRAARCAAAHRGLGLIG